MKAQKIPPRRIHAQLISLGGAILLGILAVLVALTLAAYASPDGSEVQRAVMVFFLLAAMLYVIDSMTETLDLRDQSVWFDSILKRRRRVELTNVEEILLVHEGLNLEHGVETLAFRRADGDVEQFNLGPLWQRHHIEAFLRDVEVELGKTKLVEEVR